MIEILVWEIQFNILLFIKGEFVFTHEFALFFCVIGIKCRGPPNFEFKKNSKFRRIINERK